MDVADADVQKMVEESVEHFFDDTRARQWVEAKLKAQETCAATRNALTECASELEPDYRQQIEAVLAVVEAELSAEDPATQVGNPKTLKAAVAKLDEVTLPLADALMEKAMDAMLKQRGVIS